MTSEYERLSDDKIKFYAHCGGYYLPDCELKAMALELQSLRAELATMRAYVGGEMLRSDFQTVAQMRAALDGLRATVQRARERMDANTDLCGCTRTECGCARTACAMLEAFDAELATPAPAKIPIPSDAEKAAILDDMAAVLRKHGFPNQCNDEALDYILGDYGRLLDSAEAYIGGRIPSTLFDETFNSLILDVQACQKWKVPPAPATPEAHGPDCWRYHLPCAVSRIEAVIQIIQSRASMTAGNSAYDLGWMRCAEVILTLAKSALRGEGGGDGN